MFKNEYYRVYYHQGQDTLVKLVRAMSAAEAIKQFHDVLPDAKVKDIQPL